VPPRPHNKADPERLDQACLPVVLPVTRSDVAAPVQGLREGPRAAYAEETGGDVAPGEAADAYRILDARQRRADQPSRIGCPPPGLAQRLAADLNLASVQERPHTAGALEAPGVLLSAT
jgi:hypothetical protein